MLEIMFLPFLACLILTGIHCYLGIHIIERLVIFVDLALAQMAALGAAFGILLGFSMYGTAAYIVSLIFTFLGATLFALTRAPQQQASKATSSISYHHGVHQEAIIGIIYVVAAAASILIFNIVPEATEHIRAMLVGNILLVTKSEIIKTAILYSIIGFFLWLFRRRFLLITINPEEAKNRGISIRLWDFLFYAAFGFVVTCSVRIAGVLLVFSYLIIPAVCATFITKDFNKRLTIGWLIGVVVSTLGLYFSAALDLPTGAAIVCSFGLALILVSAGRYIYLQVKLKQQQII